MWKYQNTVDIGSRGQLIENSKSPILSAPRPLRLNSFHVSFSLHQNLVDIADSDGDDLPPAPLLIYLPRAKYTNIAERSRSNEHDI
jgi:hypothetical protein